MQDDARLRTVTKCYPGAARDLPPKLVTKGRPWQSQAASLFVGFMCRRRVRTSAAAAAYSSAKALGIGNKGRSGRNIRGGRVG
jgi:hypothetical protein